MTYPIPPVAIEVAAEPEDWHKILQQSLQVVHPLRDRKVEDLSRARDSLVAQVAREQRVPLLLALGLARTENERGIPWAVSHTGDVGLMQLNARAQQLSPEVLADRRLNVELGLTLLRDLRERTGSWESALKAYHLGPTGAKRHPKTANSYVDRVRNTMRSLVRTRVRP